MLIRSYWTRVILSCAAGLILAMLARGCTGGQHQAFVFAQVTASTAHYRYHGTNTLPDASVTPGAVDVVWWERQEETTLQSN